MPNLQNFRGWGWRAGVRHRPWNIEHYVKRRERSRPGRIGRLSKAHANGARCRKRFLANSSNFLRISAKNCDPKHFKIGAANENLQKSAKNCQQFFIMPLSLSTPKFRKASPQALQPPPRPSAEPRNRKSGQCHF